ncbi:hypothetical protein KKG81_08520 [bacterium]|nr:hypothetical protein [bacterium]
MKTYRIGYNTAYDWAKSELVSLHSKIKTRNDLIKLAKVRFGWHWNSDDDMEEDMLRDAISQAWNDFEKNRLIING